MCIRYVESRVVENEVIDKKALILYPLSHSLSFHEVPIVTHAVELYETISFDHGVCQQNNQ